jgi:hypothetical protein
MSLPAFCLLFLPRPFRPRGLGVAQSGPLDFLGSRMAPPRHGSALADGLLDFVAFYPVPARSRLPVSLFAATFCVFAVPRAYIGLDMLSVCSVSTGQEGAFHCSLVGKAATSATVCRETEGKEEWLGLRQLWLAGIRGSHNRCLGSYPGLTPRTTRQRWFDSTP